jgi:tetratricopeptide (TPR) repeat protein
MAKHRQDAGQCGARPTLELSMIVRDGAVGLARCLESVDGIVDRIILGDTGSTDETISIAKQYNAEVVSVPWENDFARARNSVLSRAECDWILMLDADEMLQPDARNRITALIAQDDLFGYDVWRWNYVQDLDFRCGGEQAVVNPVVIEQARPYAAYFKSFHTRLFRRYPGIYFEHCVHENVSDRMDTLNLPRGLGNFLVHHFGYVEDAPESRKERERIYHDLGLRKLAANPGSYQAHLETGMSELDSSRQPAAALPHFELASSLEPNRSTAWLYAGICLSRIGRFAEAHDRLTSAANLDSSNPLLHAAMGDVYFQTGNYLESCKAYERAQALGDTSPLSSAKLGASEVQLGYGGKGVARVQKAIAESPSRGDLYGILATSAFIAGQHNVACEAADHRLEMEGATAFHFVLAATLYLHTNKHSRAEVILRNGSLSFPDDPDIKTLIAKSSTHH